MRRDAGDALPDLSRYRLVVFDLDGTLYRQGPVRRGMLMELMSTGGRPGRVTRLRILGRFRQLREEAALSAPHDFEARVFTRLAAETGRGEAELRDLVSEWMERRPLRRLLPARVEGTPELFDRVRGQGAAVAVWSDYPVADKLASLGLSADDQVWAGCPSVNALKPDPAGLFLLMERSNARPRDTLMVGDRLSRDGAAAKAASVDFLLRLDRRPARLMPGQYHVRDFRRIAALRASTA